MQTIWNKVANLKTIFWIYVIVVLIASLHRYVLGPDHFNNYLIFTS